MITPKYFNEENNYIYYLQKTLITTYIVTMICLDFGGSNQSINIDQTLATSSFKYPIQLQTNFTLCYKNFVLLYTRPAYARNQ